jgi:CheY-like chemotaxis protein
MFSSLFHSFSQGAEFVIELPMNSGLTSDFRERSSSPVNTFDAVSRAVVAARTGKSGRCVEAATVPRRAKEASKATKQDSVITNHCCVRGKYHILIVDDDRVGRKFIRRRFQRLFPDAVIEEAVSGEEAVAKAEEREIAYDIITMDHFMAIGDMNGAETIQMLRDNKVDAFVIGLSGNAKQGEHLLAGADDFIQKPIPSDETILDMLLSHLAPPNGWSVLTVDDVEMNNHFMSRKLRNISSPHFTDMAVAEKVRTLLIANAKSFVFSSLKFAFAADLALLQRWSITSALTGEEAVQLLRTQYFDLVILDNQLGGGISGLDVGRFVRYVWVNERLGSCSIPT